MYKTIPEAVLDHGIHLKDKPAVIVKDTIITYGELAKEMKTFAGILKNDYGIEPGMKVMISGLSRQDFLVAYLAVQYLNAITVPLDKVWMESTVLKLYEFIRPDLIITDMVFHCEGIRTASLKGLYERARTEEPVGGIEYALPDPDQVSEMLFTTGTTGMPKGAELSYRNVHAIIKNNVEGTGFSENDVVLNALPLCHSLGLRLVRMPLYLGATLVVQNGFSFTRELRTNVEKYKCTAFVCVPATMEQLTRNVKDFSGLFGSFRLMEIGAGSLSYDLKKRLPALLPETQIYNTWGSSETGGVIFLDVTGRQDKTAALGKPVSTAGVKVVDEEGREIHATDIDHAGRLAIRGDMTMAGYYNLPEINEKTLIDGWLLTNDLVYTDDEGFVYMLGRADDIINVGGEKVSPIEIENVATEYEKVHDAASVGVPDAVMGQVPVLYVAVEEPCSEEEIQRFLGQRLEPFKLPKHIIKIREIPRNRMKKLDRKAVRALWEENSSSSEPKPGKEFVDLILSRRSIRNFLDKPVEREVLETLVKAGIQAPTGKNMQTWCFTVITGRDVIEEIRQKGTQAANREKTGFYGFQNPAALILVTNDTRNDNGALDSACAAENILLAAHAMGLGGCWLNGLTRISDQPEIRQLLTEMKIPERHRVWAMIALGYPAQTAKPVPRKENVVHWVEDLPR